MGNIAHLPDGSADTKTRATTTADMAKLAQVGERTIKDAKAAHKAGLTEAVKDGAMSVSEAAKIARGTPEKPKAKPPVPDPSTLPPNATKEEQQQLAQQLREEAADEFDPLAELETAYMQVRELQAQIEAASADDVKASAMHWQRMSMVADKQRDDAMARAYKMEQELKHHAKWLRRIGQHFGEDVSSRVAGAVDAGIRQLGTLVGEAGSGKVLPAVERALELAGQQKSVAARPPAAVAAVATAPGLGVPAAVPGPAAAIRAPYTFADDVEYI